MWKVGDRVKFLVDFYPGYEKGDIVKLVKISTDNIVIPCKDDPTDGWSLDPKYFGKGYILLGKDLKCETDYLDAFQENFREGV